MKAMFPVELGKIDPPLGNLKYVLLKCPRCLKGIGVSKSMLLGMDSILCLGSLGNTGMPCKGHYRFHIKRMMLEFLGTASTSAPSPPSSLQL